MSFITLYLTIEYSIVPQLSREHPDWGLERVAGRKYPYFYYQLSQDPGGDLDSPEFGIKSKFGVNISFRKIYWSMLQELGVAALSMLAVGDLGVTVAVWALGVKSNIRKLLQATLCRSRRCFVHAIGPATLRTFFSLRDIQYTAPRLLRQLRAEPLPTTCILLIDQYDCEGWGISINTEEESANGDLQIRLAQSRQALETSQGSGV